MTASRACPRCGAGLGAEEALGGLCAGCLLVAGLERVTEDAPAAPKRPAPPIAELAPHFPDLELVELVGQGGMGAVYRVRQKKLGREAALKILQLDADASPAFGERFEREARALAALSHDNIVAVYDCGRAGPHWYFLMEFVDGVSLRQMIRAREVDPRTALGIVAQICDALQAAHDRGIVHRDVKPENVLVDRRGRVKILDFGLAKLLNKEPRTGTLTETGQVMGTPRYMAPEQWERPLSVDHRADIYSVGVVFYELLTGELPMGAFALPSQKGGGDARIDPVVMKTLAKEPERRYQHASEVRTDVQKIQSTPPPPIVVGGEPDGRKKRVWLWVALPPLGCLALLAIPAALFLFWGVARPRQAAEHERAAQEHAAARAEAEARRIEALAAFALADPPVLAGADPRAACVADAVWRLYLDREAGALGDPVEVVPGTVRFTIGSLHSLAFALECAADSWLVSPATRPGGRPSDGYHLESAAGTVIRAPVQAAQPHALAFEVGPGDPCGLNAPGRGQDLDAVTLAPSAFLLRIDRRRWMPALLGAVSVEATLAEHPVLQLEFADGSSTIVRGDQEDDPAWQRLFAHARRGLSRR
jgi:tRNA A-37 threonylcarbamoyl transferase component Bud32